MLNMKNKIILVSFFLFSLLFSCQKAEKKVVLNATDYIANIPKDKSFQNKFIVLEFWATWCAPCLSAVPHINDLQDKFKSNPDLIFVSITDEKSERVLKTLKHVDFKSIVISDQTKKTHKALGISEIPVTVLIDNNGIVRWKGSPEELNEDLLKNFIDGKFLINNKDEKSDLKYVKSEADKKNEKLENIAFEILKNKQTKYSFTLTNTTGTISMFVNGLAKGKYIASNKKISEIISDLEDITEQQILIPEKLRNNKYILIYKNLEIKSLESGIKDIKFNLLKTLNLKENIQTQNTVIYKLKVIDKNKLEASKESKTEIGHSGTSSNIVCSNTEIKSLIDEIKTSFKISLKDETKLNGKYDFLIRNKSMKELKIDLEKYGLKLEKTIEKEKIYKYE